MAKERIHKKPVGVTLDMIKDKMKEKRNKKLARAAGFMRGSHSRLGQKANVGVVASDVQVTLRQNNVALAIALQAAKEKLREANAVILQLQGEYQNLFVQLLMFKKKVRQQQALSTSSPLVKESKLPLEADFESPRNERIIECKTAVCEISPIRAASPKLVAQPDSSQIALPPTVNVKPRHDDKARKTRRRSDRVQESRPVDKATSDLPRPPKRSLESTETIEAHVEDRVREEQAPVRKVRERGRRPERAPLKKPWENPKSRARSRSRDRRAPATQQQINTTLGFNDTFDFDCEEAVHLTPFKAKTDQPDEPARESLTPTSPAPEPLHPDTSSPKTPSSESEDSLYMPWKKTRRGRTPPEMTTTITTRRGRFTNKNRSPRKSVLVDQESRQEDKEPDQEVDGDQSTFTNSPHQFTTHQQEPLRQELMDEAIPSVGALPEVELMTIDDVLSNFADTLCQASSPPIASLAHQRVTTRKNRALCGSGTTRQISGHAPCSLSDVSNLSPAAYRRLSRPCSETQCSSTEAAPPRGRRRTQAVNYKEPSLSAKLRRGDKHTDLRFLRPGSPIFKSSGRRTGSSVGRQNKLDKYNESFVGCR
nr:shugoshin 1-like [Nerophis lumbriciformis]